MKNNDRFKLRCWDKENKRFLHPLSFDLSPKGILILSFAIEGKKYLDVNNTDRYVLIQCTGLKDKNKKLIYEGDIVEILDNEQENAFIYFDEHTAQFVVRTLDVDFDFDHISNDELEVIGNIHENPELLER